MPMSIGCTTSVDRKLHDVKSTGAESRDPRNALRITIAPREEEEEEEEEEEQSSPMYLKIEGLEVISIKSMIFRCVLASL